MLSKQLILKVYFYVSLIKNNVHVSYTGMDEFP